MNDIVIASLFGSKIITQIPRIAGVENYLGKHVLPVIAYPLANNPLGISNSSGSIEVQSWTANAPRSIEEQFFPLSMRVDKGEWFTLPYEPMINIQGKNNIVKRSVAKYNDQASVKNFFGTVKERWAQDDYKITITGIFYGSNEHGVYEDTFPIEDFTTLKEYLLQGKELEVACPLFELLGINYIAIEEFNFPFTKGENVQAYEIKALSDVPFDALLIED